MNKTKSNNLSDLLVLVLWLAYIKPSASGDKTVSAMIVAPVESGLTSLVEVRK